MHNAKGRVSDFFKASVKRYTFPYPGASVGAQIVHEELLRALLNKRVRQSGVRGIAFGNVV